MNTPVTYQHGAPRHRPYLLPEYGSINPSDNSMRSWLIHCMELVAPRTDVPTSHTLPKPSCACCPVSGVCKGSTTDGAAVGAPWKSSSSSPDLQPVLVPSKNQSMFLPPSPPWKDTGREFAECAWEPSGGSIWVHPSQEEEHVWPGTGTDSGSD